VGRESATEAVAWRDKASRLWAFLFPPVVARHQFFSSMARLTSSGVTLDDALHTIRSTGRGRLRTLADAGSRGLRQGQLLSVSLEQVDYMVPAISLGILQTGERTGELSSTLNQLAEMEQESIASFRKLLGSMAYPLVVMLFSCFLMPVPTLVLGSGSAYAGQVAGQVASLAGALAGAWLLFRFAVMALARFVIHLPGPLELTLFPGKRAFFFLALRTSLRSGLSIREALALGSKAFGSAANRKLVDDAIASLDRGETLTRVLGPLVEPRHLVVLASGEQSGQMEDSFAEFYEIYSARAAGRRKLMLIIASIIMTIGILAYVAMQLMSGMQQAVEAPMMELEDVLEREMKGIWQ